MRRGAAVAAALVFLAGVLFAVQADGQTAPDQACETVTADSGRKITLCMDMPAVPVPTATPTPEPTATPLPEPTATPEPQAPAPVWTRADPGTGQRPTITIDASIYPDSLGVQFLLNGVVDERSTARPNGYDPTGPNEGSEYHMFPTIDLVAGDVIGANWVDINGVAWSDSHIVGGETPPDPTPDPTTVPEPTATPDGATPVGWQEAVDTGNMTAIRDWYMANTGFEAFYSATLGRNLTAADLTYIAGPLTITEPGTVIEGAYIDGPVKIHADNVTIRGSVINVGGYSYGVQIGGGGGNPNVNNWTIDYVSFRNAAFEASGNLAVIGNRPIYTTRPGTARHNQLLDGYSTGFYSVSPNDQVWEYNFVDRIVRTPGSHNTGMSFQHLIGASSDASNVRVYRNLLLDGTSAPLSFYSESSGTYTSFHFIENILDLPYVTNTWYCAYVSSNGAAPSTQFVDIRWEGNIFGQTSYPTCGKGGPTSGARYGWAGNRYIDGTPIP